MVIDDNSLNALLIKGELAVTGRLVDASNATLFGHIDFNAESVEVIYKPIAGERPLWDFPNGTLAAREVAAYHLSQFGGFHIVPVTIFRDGPFGPGAVQRWIEVDEEVDIISLAQSQNFQLRKMALFDAIVNNTDRKIGHLLPDRNGQVFGCDHGVCFHEEDKLRTVLWQWMGEEVTVHERVQLQSMLDRFEEFGEKVRTLLTDAEIVATKNRITRVLDEGCFPSPSEEWPPVPWPPI
jgi:hypothetical protein